ncbi:beta-ribofuranosylaminobenzene 5'-phosphate synthase family protein [Xanthobacter sp. KR7-225]|uniref:beta-ribofuranosylaminobenzene 5'-phosphate synthase family protein n=1 Tax=Xanthobacter sp. KR7-225 TaxID=3156613 RepID=UPI0032B59208
MSGGAPAAALRVEAPGRLHLGFIDLGGALGRRFGSLGVTLDEPQTVIEAACADRDSLEGPEAERAGAARDAARAALGIADRCAIAVRQALPAHAGFGSGTQMDLAVGAAVARLAGRPLPARALADLMGRGRRSAIGTEAFAGGGVILDGGRRPDREASPPLLARLPFPDAWRVILMLDRDRHGLSGAEETRAMAQLPPFPQQLAAHLSHLVLLKALPALAEADADAFGAAIGEWQERLGDHYAAAQSGARYLSPDVAQAAHFLRGEGVAGVGQSSWGPTGFAVVGDGPQAERLVEALRRRFASFTNLSFLCVRGRNQGAAFRSIGAAVP